MSRYYAVEVVRESDQRCFMLCGWPSDDPDDTWYFDDNMGFDEHNWSRLKSIVTFHRHRDHNHWICDFVLPQFRHILECWPGSRKAKEQGGLQPHTLTVYLVDESKSLKLRYTPMLCKTFNLSGEPFNGAIKQGYYREQ